MQTYAHKQKSLKAFKISHASRDEINELLSKNEENNLTSFEWSDPDQDMTLKLKLVSGDELGIHGDYLVIDSDGEYHIITRPQFENTYEKVTVDTPETKIVAEVERGHRCVGGIHLHLALRASPFNSPYDNYWLEAEINGRHSVHEVNHINVAAIGEFMDQCVKTLSVIVRGKRDSA